MKIRATILAMLAVLGLSLGAMAGEVYEKELSLPLTTLDTSDFVQSYLINDTINWTSTPFGVGQDFDQILGRIMVETADTHTATATVYDSMYFVFQSKLSATLDSTWYTMWTSPLLPLASFDSTDGWARGDAGAFNIPADSMPNVGNYFRFVYYFICEEDSMRSAHTLNIVGTSSYFDLPHSMKAHMLFRSSGYNNILAASDSAAGFDIPDRDSIAQLQLSADGADEVLDTVSTYGDGNIDHIPGDVMKTTNETNPHYGIYERIVVNYDPHIYTRWDTQDTAIMVNDADDCTTADADTFTNYTLKCCADGDDTTAYASWLDDSTSWADSNTGLLYFEGTNTDYAALADGDSAAQGWTVFLTSTWTSGGLTSITTYPGGRYMRARTGAATATDDFDTIGVVIWIDREGSHEGPTMDYMGVMTTMEDGSDAATTADTIKRWPYTNNNHIAGQWLKCVDDAGDYFAKLATMIDPVPTTGHAKCSTGGYLVLMQSADGLNWTATDSAQKVAGLAAAGQVPEYDTLFFARGLQYWALRNQVHADSTDASTPVVWDVFTQMLR